LLIIQVFITYWLNIHFLFIKTRPQSKK